MDKQIIFPSHNYGWLHVKNMPAGTYTFYIQFAGAGPAKGLEQLTLTTYGLQQCAQLNGGGCTKLPAAVNNGSWPLDDSDEIANITEEDKNLTNHLKKEELDREKEINETKYYEWSPKAGLLKGALE
jgi:hypothetical protein